MHGVFENIDTLMNVYGINYSSQLVTTNCMHFIHEMKEQHLLDNMGVIIYHVLISCKGKYQAVHFWLENETHHFYFRPLKD